MARRTLDVILADDLAAIVEELPASALRDSVYYEVVEYQTYARGKYGARAYVDFFFLRDGLPKIVRKYRYHTRFGRWERYYNAYHHLQDTTRAVGQD